MKTIRKLMAALTISGALLAAACADSPTGGTEVEPAIIPRFDGGGGFGSGNRLGSDSSANSSGQDTAAGDSTTITAGGGGGFGSGN
jgi:hypothetical protein